MSYVRQAQYSTKHTQTHVLKKSTCVSSITQLRQEGCGALYRVQECCMLGMKAPSTCRRPAHMPPGPLACMGGLAGCGGRHLAAAGARGALAQEGEAHAVHAPNQVAVVLPAHLAAQAHACMDTVHWLREACVLMCNKQESPRILRMC